jgi:hypothetical protein
MNAASPSASIGCPAASTGAFLSLWRVHVSASAGSNHGDAS